MLFRLLGVLTLLACAAGAGSAAEAPTPQTEGHAPILIRSDADLLGPDALRGNGVRGGSGTPGDPWRISGWRIAAPEGGYAIAISNVRASIVVEDVELTSSSATSAALLVTGAADARLQSVTASGTGAFLITESSTLVVEDAEAAFEGGSFCISARDADLTLRRSTFTGGCGGVVAAVSASSLTAENVSYRGSANGFLVQGPAERASFRNVRLEATPESDSSPRALHAYGISIEGVEDVRVERGELAGYRWACLAVKGAARAAVRDVIAQECKGEGGTAGMHLSLAPGRSAVLSGSTVRRSDVGVLVTNGTVRLSGGILQENGVGLLAAGSASVEADGTLLQDNDVHARGEAGGRLDVSGARASPDCPASRDDCPLFQGGVQRPAAATPPTPLETPMPPALLAVLLSALLATTLALRRRSP